MADAELYNEIYTLLGCKDNIFFDLCYQEEDDSDVWSRGPCYYEETEYHPTSLEIAHDAIAMYAIRWLCVHGWRTLFIDSNRIKCGYAPDGGICDLSITGPVAQTLCEAIKRQLEREDND